MTRRRSALVAAAALAMLAASCGGEKKPPPDLPLACETRSCICIEPATPFWRVAKEAPVEWRPTGEAFCPAGFELRLAKK